MKVFGAEYYGFGGYYECQYVVVANTELVECSGLTLEILKRIHPLKHTGTHHELSTFCWQ